MTNEYYNDTGNPLTGSSGSSALMRAQFSLIEDAFDLFPDLSTNANKIFVVNATGDGVDAVSTLTGGIGLGTLTSGGILLGAGTGAITAMNVLADGEIVIGDGVTAPTTLSAFSSSSGTLKSQYGGLGFDASTIQVNQFLAGTGAGAIGIKTASEVKTILGFPLSGAADGTISIGDGSADPTTVAAFTSSSGTLKHEYGGLEADISSVVNGNMIVGTGAGTVGLETPAQIKTRMGLPVSVSDKQNGAAGDGATDDRSVFNTIVAAYPSEQIGINIAGDGDRRIATTFSFAENTFLQFDKDAKITADSGATITVYGYESKGDYPFIGDGTYSFPAGLGKQTNFSAIGIQAYSTSDLVTSYSGQGGSAGEGVTGTDPWNGGIWFQGRKASGNTRASRPYVGIVGEIEDDTNGGTDGRLHICLDDNEYLQASFTFTARGAMVACPGVPFPKADIAGVADTDNGVTGVVPNLVMGVPTGIGDERIGVMDVDKDAVIGVAVRNCKTFSMSPARSAAYGIYAVNDARKEVQLAQLIGRYVDPSVDGSEDAYFGIITRFNGAASEGPWFHNGKIYFDPAGVFNAESIGSFFDSGNGFEYGAATSVTPTVKGYASGTEVSGTYTTFDVKYTIFGSKMCIALYIHMASGDVISIPTGEEVYLDFGTGMSRVLPFDFNGNTGSGSAGLSYAGTTSPGDAWTTRRSIGDSGGANRLFLKISGVAVGWSAGDIFLSGQVWVDIE